MYIFAINTIDAFGNRKRVEVKAKDPESALRTLKEEGYRAELKDIISAAKDSLWNRLKKLNFKSRFSSVSANDILRLTKMIGSSLKRGRTLKESLEFIGENEDSAALRTVILELKERMGKPFASQVDVFAIYPQYFDEGFLGIIQAGEISSNLGEYLLDYVEEKKRQMSLTAKFHSVLMSRGFTFLMVVGVAVAVVAFVIPQFSQLFGDKMKIPWAMGILLSISKFTVKYGLAILIALVLAISSFVYVVTNRPAVRWWWDDLLLNFPILGKTLRTYYTAHFAYLLSTLLTKNVDIINSMNIIIRQSANVCMRKTYENLVTSMQGGDGLFTAIIKENEAGRHYLITSIVQAAKVGGSTASLGETLLDVRNDLEELFVTRLERSIKAFSFVFYCFILLCAVFIAYSIGSAIMAFYQNAQSLI